MKSLILIKKNMHFFCSVFIFFYRNVKKKSEIKKCLCTLIAHEGKKNIPITRVDSKKIPYRRCHLRWVRIPGKNLQKSKKINTLDPKIRLKNYPGGSY
jgi:aromatic ring-opening dioxygenase LigB subunit